MSIIKADFIYLYSYLMIPPIEYQIISPPNPHILPIKKQMKSQQDDNMMNQQPQLPSQRSPGSTPTPTPVPEATFPSIRYFNPQHIRYIEDMLLQNPNPAYKQLDLESLDERRKQQSQYSSIHYRLYKKFGRDGFLLKGQEVAKKKKKGGDQNFFDCSDKFIDDGLAYAEKDVRESTLSDFKAFNGSLLQFYRSLDYRPEIITQAKRKADKKEGLDITQQDRDKIANILTKIKNKQRQNDQKKPEESQPPQLQQQPQQ